MAHNRRNARRRVLYNVAGRSECGGAFGLLQLLLQCVRLDVVDRDIVVRQRDKYVCLLDDGELLDRSARELLFFAEQVCGLGLGRGWLLRVAVLVAILLVLDVVVFGLVVDAVYAQGARVEPDKYTIALDC